MPSARRALHNHPGLIVRARARAVIVAICFIGGLSAEAGTVSWFTEQASFLNGLTGTSFTNNFDGLPPNPVPNPSPFSGNGYTYQATAAGGLYRAFNNPYALTPNDLESPLIFDTFNGITAVGGLFSLTNSDENRAAGTLSLTIFSGSSQTFLSGTTAPVTSDAPTFLGLIYYGAPAAITKVTLSTAATNLYPTAEQLTVGVPEPATLAGAATGILMIGLAIRSRRRLSKAAFALLAAASLAFLPHAAVAVLPEPPAWTAPPSQRPSLVDPVDRPSWAGSASGMTPG